MKRLSALGVALALALAIPLDGSAADLGQCAHQRDPDKKIASCIDALKLTPYPQAHQWIYREMARAHRERGDIQGATTSYTLSLAAEDREGVRREMEELTQPRKDVAPGYLSLGWLFLP